MPAGHLTATRHSTCTCRYAPEHLIINCDDAASWLPLLQHAGSVFLGRYTPESVGDYASGALEVWERELFEGSGDLRPTSH